MPAVDVAGGRATQVMPGAADDPAQVAQGLVGDGATWVHLVDLDRAFRRGDNAWLMRELISAMRVPVQLSGGIDDASSAQWALQTSAARVNLASTVTVDVALVESLVARHGSRVVVGLDVEGDGDGDHVVARGTAVRLGPLDEVVSRVAATGAQEFLVADATRDGTRTGADVELFARVSMAIRSRVPEARIVLSGGVSSLADLSVMRPLQAHGAWAVVLGSALHHRRFTMEQAQQAVDGHV